MATTIAQIGGFELWDILQLAQTSRMSIKLSVESPHGTGSMYFQGGNLLHAVAGDDEGDDAVNIILDWREGSVSSSQLPEDCPTTVRHSSIVALLMDRARQRDEQQRDKPPPPPPQQTKPPPPPVPAHRPATILTPPVVPSAPLPATPAANSAASAKSPPPPRSSQPEPAPVRPDKELSDMELRIVKAILEEIDDHLTGGLVSVDIISKSSGMSIAGINSAPKACAMFNRLSEQLHTALTRADEPLARGINKFIIEGDNGLYIFVIELDDRHRWAMLVDGGKAQLGMVFVVIPEIQPRLVEALANRG
jgi:hypothetical protein